MQFSTGLKIKVSEALSSGAPLIAHAHAMEGYPTDEPLHLLESFQAIAIELAKLSFDPSPLPKLAARSRKVCAEIRESVSQTIEATRRQLVAKCAPMICVITPMEAFDPASLLNDHLIATLDYLRFTAPLVIYVTGAPAKGAKFDVLQRFEIGGHIFADPQLMDHLGENTPETWIAIELSALLDIRGYERAYFMADCREELWFSTGSLRQAFIRHDVIEMTGGDADALIDNLRATVDIIPISATPKRIMRWQEETGIVEVVHAPLRRTGAFESLERRASGKK